MKIKLDGFIVWKKYDYEKEGTFYFRSGEMEDRGYVTVMPYSMEVEVPDNFNPVPKQVAILEKQKAKVRADFNQRIAELNDQIGKLQALTFDEVKA